MSEKEFFNSALPENVDEIKKWRVIFSKYELRKIIYEIAKGLREDDKPVEAIKIILLGWNWRAYAGVKISNEEFDIQINNFLKKHDTLRCFLEKNNVTLRTIDFEVYVGDKKIGDWIAEGFDELCEEKAIGYTGASKLFHMFFPNVFMMWDRKIIDTYHGDGEENHWRKHTNGGGNCYLVFLKETQSFIRKYVKKRELEEKNLVKIMDEYNYAKYTLSSDLS